MSKETNPRQLLLFNENMQFTTEINRERNPLPLSSLDDVLLSLDSFEELKKQITRRKLKKKKNTTEKNKRTKIEQLDIDYISNSAIHTN